MAKFITAQEAAKLIPDGATVGLAGMGLSGWPEEVACAVRDSFKESGMEFLDEVVRRKGIHVQLWLEGEDGEGFGRGRVELLQLVDELGSLSKAAKQLGMSYRGAWGKIKKAERIAGETLVDASGTKRDGYSLTPAGRELVQRFQQWYADVESFAKKRAEALFSDFDKE